MRLLVIGNGFDLDLGIEEETEIICITLMSVKATR